MSIAILIAITAFATVYGIIFMKIVDKIIIKHL